MSYHILHLLSHHLRVRVKLDQLHVEDREAGTERTVPLTDIAVIVCAAPDAAFTAGALRRMAELNVLLIVCNEKFEPCALTLPYYRATNTELLRRQVEWTPEWKTAMWRQIITAKVRNQAAVVSHLKRAHTVLTGIAERCADPQPVAADVRRLNPNPGEAQSLLTSAATSQRPPSLASITASRRDEFRSDTPEACESRAARHYWKHLLPRLSEWQHTDGKGSVPKNQMLLALAK